MNWFQRFFTNPNVHAIGAGLAPGLMMAFPQYAPAIGAIGTVAGFVAAATPENPVSVPMPSAPVVPAAPAQAASGSMHQTDYVQLAMAIVAAMAAQKNPAPEPAKPAT
jgi:hypothetical protein